MLSNLTLKLTTVLLLISLTVFSQKRMPGMLSRFEIGYSFVKATSEYKGNFLQYRPDMLSDTMVIKSDKVKTKAAYGVTLGTYFPLSRMGNSSSLTLDVNYVYNMMLWQGIGGGFYQTVAGWDFSGITVQMGLPVGLSYKMGADAVLDKTKHFCAGFGAGVLPAYSLTSFEEGVGANFGVSPYVKLEAGFFAGICMKVRLLHSFGNVPLIEKDKGFGGMYDSYLSNFSLSGKSNTMISIVLMPFSWGWPDDGWWNRSNNSYRMYKGWKWRHKNNY